jgi:hypothetical protein
MLFLKSSWKSISVAHFRVEFQKLPCLSNHIFNVTVILLRPRIAFSQSH